MFNSKSKVQTSKVIARDGWLCFYCWRFLTSELMTIDHVIPTLRGGPDTLENVVISCRKCNASKGDMNLDEYTHYMNLRSFISNALGHGNMAINHVFDLIMPHTGLIERVAFPGRIMGVERIAEEYKHTWEKDGALVVEIRLGRISEDVAFFDGLLFDYYSMKRD